MDMLDMITPDTEITKIYEFKNGKLGPCVGEIVWGGSGGWFHDGIEIPRKVEFDGEMIPLCTDVERVDYDPSTGRYTGRTTLTASDFGCEMVAYCLHNEFDEIGQPIEEWSVVGKYKS
ncbi:MAG: hypothetical protein ACYSR9_03535 [Planctomycetota bacterium]|jgi:hypothetical protein